MNEAGDFTRLFGNTRTLEQWQIDHSWSRCCHAFQEKIEMVGGISRGSWQMVSTPTPNGMDRAKASSICCAR
jgi:hypothetical protein